MSLVDNNIECREPAVPERPGRKPYAAPQLVVYGNFSDLTGWVGGPWGEFFGGGNPDGGWNPFGGQGGYGTVS